jgi:hypothetical protein
LTHATATTAVRPTRAARAYLAESFPAFQAVAVASAYLCSYLVYGEAQEHQVFVWLTLAGAATVVLLFLFRRIVDDTEDLQDDLEAEGTTARGEVQRRRRGLLGGALIVAAAASALNAWHRPALLVALAAILWTPVATLLKRTTSNRLIRSILHESCAAVILAYTYAIWREAGGERLSMVTVAATVALFWVGYLFWDLTRKAGRDGWPPLGIGRRPMRSLLLGLLVVTAAAGVAVGLSASMPTFHLVYSVALPLAVGVTMLRWWSPYAAGAAELPGAGGWAGLPLVVGVELGVLLAVLIAELGR